MNLQTEWIVGFVDGEGCFHVGISRHKEMTLGYQVLPEFVVVQHKRDIKVLHALKSFFECGKVVNNHGDRKAYRVRNLDHLANIILPFFEQHDLKTQKRLDFISFRKVVRWMKEGKHLTETGFADIQKIKKGMNRGRLR